MCLELIKRVCCNSVSLSDDELERVRNMNPVTQRFLAKRRSIIGCLFGFIILDAVVSTVLLVLAFAGIGLMTIVGNRDDAINMTIVMIVLAIYLGVDIAVYQLVKRWYNSWYDYRAGIYYSKCMLVIIYGLYPVISSNTYADNENGNVIKLFLDIINTAISIISAIHVFILKSNNLAREVNDSYEYRFIAKILKAMYVPIVIIVVVLMIDYTKDPLVISFCICYMIMICASFVIHESSVAPVEEVFSWICMIMLVAIGADSDPVILGIIIKMYVNYIITSVVVIDLTNEWIIKSRENISESTGGIAHIMKDMNIAGDIRQLMSVEKDKKDNAGNGGNAGNYDSVAGAEVSADSSEIIV